MYTTCTEIVQLKGYIINIIILWVIYAQMSASDKALPVQVGIQMGLQKCFYSIVQYTRRAAPAVLYCLGRAHEMMSRLAQTLSNKVISNYLHSAFVCRFFSCSQALQPTNNHGRSTQQQQ